MFFRGLQRFHKNTILQINLRLYTCLRFYARVSSCGLKMALLMEFGTANANILALLINSNILAFMIPDIEAYSSDGCRGNQKLLTHCLVDLETIYYLVGL